MNNSWFVIVNPNAGNGNFKKLWSQIQHELAHHNIVYEFEFTTHHKHEIELVHKAISKGYSQIISCGGDGTLHHVVNGVMNQELINSNLITLGVIPLGTGNDWIKTYGISKNIHEAVQLIKNQNTIYQDIGHLQLENTSSYFNNVAGIGYDGYVVNKLNNLKKFGPIAYLISGISGLLFYKRMPFKVVINNSTIEDYCLMTLFGICKYSGGGMQLTDYKSSNDGFFDITFAKNLTFKDLVFNIKKLYNGKIVTHNKVETYLTDKISVIPTTKDTAFIQADGELIGTGSIAVSIVKNAIQFVIP
ncbi:diacylglycerol kinase family protein [uncultured Tenacibaculum sp.]|uniref:diacylglycerol/lipid kinase family protein n=1 Tax=uncultured Tenacibaculum sp. TaxID=174713 RepID=UPI00261D3BAD|nr:diacylglycerol kinase family protein [uncultured Tenacibaculum sp.]